MNKPRIWRHKPGQWYVRSPYLQYSVGPFPDHAGAIRYATWIARGL